ncbi:hypothetical protein TWF506_002373 [Arthrobotrys conoides]|uniref:Protein SPT2 n=1 Tax=Arthrobotrys conoides TaxID=74498 RepID=A0AAN8NNP3_9PEZI
MATGPGGGFSIFNLLDQYEGSGPKGVASGPGPTARSSTTNGRNSDGRRNGDGSPRKERPAPIGVPSRNMRDADSTSNTVSPLNTFTPPISKALDATEASEKKRKLEENNGTVPPTKKSRFEGMTKEQKIAEVKRLKALKAARDAARANGSGSGGGSGRDGNGSGSAASNPNSPITAEAPKKPAKGSYAEIMERAKQIQATSSVPAKIVHKETKVEKKKIGKTDKPEATKRLPAISTKTQGSKTTVSSGVSKPSPTKKSVGRPVGRPTGSRPDDKKSAPTKPAPSKPRPQEEWSGTARPSANAKPLSSKPDSKASDRSRDRSWERERERDRYRAPSKRYVYAESEDDDEYSSDDMEATGVDILEEEDRSRAAAIREDIEAERLERKLAAEKAAKRRQLGRR